MVPPSRAARTKEVITATVWEGTETQPPGVLPRLLEYWGQMGPRDGGLATSRHDDDF